ncbi:MAG: CPBP family intramembrane metalloprotease [Tenacibaculum sp.]|nr:CPBP family intramembrane metalloprotease [Tenacibaculum sp.]
MSKTLKILLIVFISFIMHYLFDDFYFKEIRKFLDEKIEFIGISHILTYLIVGIPIFLGTILIGKPKNILLNLGLNKSILKGVIISLIFTMPMLVGFSIFFNLNSKITFNNILIGAISAGFFEELYFRGFLFGLIFRKTKIGFIPSIIIGTVIFAMGHLYQSQELVELIGIFMTTFAGGILFAWVFCEWSYNLWVSIFLHLFMNLFWIIFAVSDNALGGTYANLFRFITIIIVVYFTIVYKKKKGLSLEINRRTIWRNI